MTDEAKRLRNNYMRSWRAKNKDKVKSQTELYWERKAKEVSEIQKAN
jgi:hypothetical protein